MPNIHLHSYNCSPASGYGKILMQLEAALWNLDIDVLDKSWNVLNFCKPVDYVFKDYSIGYTPWESTMFPRTWEEPLKRVDKFITTASWLVDVFSPWVDDVFVVPHGIDPIWSPLRHYRDESRPFTFVHMGEPATRKGGDIILAVWHKYFRNNKNVQLIIKTTGYSPSRVKSPDGSIVASAYDMPNITVIDRVMNDAEIWQLFALSDCLVYPTRGEGFGLIPFEAIASGLPTIYPSQGIGDYADNTLLSINQSQWVESTAQGEHPGKWMEHLHEELHNLMSSVLVYYEHWSKEYRSYADRIHRDYAWPKIAKQLTEIVFE